MKTLISAFAISSLLAPVSGYAFRCGGSLVSLRDTLSRVRQICGEPTLTDTRRKETVQRLGLGDEKRSYITVETWVYDTGSSNLLQYLRFENRSLVSEWTGDYGGREKPDPSLCNASLRDIALEKDQLEIRLKCGEPTQRNHVEDRIMPALTVVDPATTTYPLLTTGISVDEWVYEFGPQKSDTVLRFENGILMKVSVK